MESNNNPKDTAPSETNESKPEDQQVVNTTSNTSTPTPKKTVRFQDDLPKSPSLPTENVVTAIPSPTSSTKKTIRFADDLPASSSSPTGDAIPTPISAPKKIVRPSDTSEPPELSASHFHSLAERLQATRETSSYSLPTSPFLNTTPRTDPARPASHSSSTGFEPSYQDADRAPASSLSAMDVRYRAETGTMTSGELGSEIQDDEGEKDEQGNVKGCQ